MVKKVGDVRYFSSDDVLTSREERDMMEMKMEIY